MTPAVKLLKQSRTAFELREYEHDPDAAAYGLEAAEKLGLDPASVFKTLIIELDGRELAMAIIPVAPQLNLKRAAKTLGAKRASMAQRAAAERATGYVMGGISPLGQRKRLRAAIDVSAQNLSMMYISGGRRGLDLGLAPTALIDLIDATVGVLSSD